MKNTSHVIKCGRIFYWLIRHTFDSYRKGDEQTPVGWYNVPALSLLVAGVLQLRLPVRTQKMLMLSPTAQHCNLLREVNKLNWNREREWPWISCFSNLCHFVLPTSILQAAQDVALGCLHDHSLEHPDERGNTRSNDWHKVLHMKSFTNVLYLIYLFNMALSKP